MAHLARFVDQDAVVRAHAGIYHADVGRDKGDFAGGGGVDEGGGGLLFGGEDDAVAGFDAEGGYALVYGVEGVFCGTLAAERNWRKHLSGMYLFVPACRC